MFVRMFALTADVATLTARQMALIIKLSRGNIRGHMYTPSHIVIKVFDGYLPKRF